MMICWLCSMLWWYRKKDKVPYKSGIKEVIHEKDVLCELSQLSTYLINTKLLVLINDCYEIFSLKMVSVLRQLIKYVGAYNNGKSFLYFEALQSATVLFSFENIR